MERLSRDLLCWARRSDRGDPDEEDHMRRRIVGAMISAATIAAMLGVPAAAAGAGSPPSFTSPGGVTAHGSRYLALPERHGTTTVREIVNGETVRSRSVDGRFAVPAVTLDGDPGGLSADARTLVLVDRGPTVTRGPTQVLILDARSLGIRQRLTFRGAFTFDAISPDGSTIYFIQYLSPRDQTQYAVRAYDVAAGRMVPTPIVDPDEHAGEMRGYPLRRITSSDGRWAYTLYDGGADGAPFVHALDTVDGRAVCVDLDGFVTQRQLRDVHMTMSASGPELTVGTTKTPAAVIDPDTLQASAPPAPGADGGGGGIPWVIIAIAGALGLGAGGAVIVSRHRRASRLATPDA
jgi:hypothetical protein